MIYFDNASTTKLNSDVFELINKINNELYFNPSSLYGYGIKVSSFIEECRQEMLTLLGARSFDNFIFTSGASEANNFAIRGAIKKGGKLLVSHGEHPSIYNLAKQLKNEGFDVDFINLNSDGTIDINDLINKLPNTTVVSIIHTSNETGAVNDLNKISKIIKNFDSKIIFHSDGVQSLGKNTVNLQHYDVDLYTISSHKINGPKGMGGLFIKKGVNLKPLIFGGEQEKGLRAGTENISGIAGFNLATKIAVENAKNTYEILTELNNYMYEKLLSIKDIRVLKFANASPHILLFSMPKLKSETLLHLLEEYDILVGNGSACASRHSGNRILDNIGINNDFIDGSIRISFSKENNKKEIDEFILVLEKVTNEYYKTIKF